MGKNRKLHLRFLVPLAVTLAVLLPAPVSASPGTLALLGGSWDHTAITV